MKMADEFYVKVNTPESKMPELPEPTWFRFGGQLFETDYAAGRAQARVADPPPIQRLYTADQLRAYGEIAKTVRAVAERLAHPPADNVRDHGEVLELIEKLRDQEWFDDWEGLPKTREESYVQGYLAALDELTAALEAALGGGQ
jgi:hypothetical protein